MGRAGLRLLPPVGDPQKVICVGLNYRDHCGEQGARLPPEPIIFSKFPSALTGPFDDIVLPEESKVTPPPPPRCVPPPVTSATPVEPAPPLPPRRWTGRWSWPPSSGRRGGASRYPPLSPTLLFPLPNLKRVPVVTTRPPPRQESVALDHVVGYTVANDVSARDWQLRNGRQWLLGKTFDTFCPLGPALVTKEAVTGGEGTGTRVGQGTGTRMGWEWDGDSDGTGTRMGPGQDGNNDRGKDRAEWGQ